MISLEDKSFDELYPQPDYAKLRRSAEKSAPVCYKPDAAAPVSVIGRPQKSPAWPRHQPPMEHKAARFEKLNRWGSRGPSVPRVVAWGLIAAGAVSVAGPALLLHLPH